MRTLGRTRAKVACGECWQRVRERCGAEFEPQSWRRAHVGSLCRAFPVAARSSSCLSPRLLPLPPCLPVPLAALVQDSRGSIVMGGQILAPRHAPPRLLSGRSDSSSMALDRRRRCSTARLCLRRCRRSLPRHVLDYSSSSWESQQDGVPDSQRGARGESTSYAIMGGACRPKGSRFHGYRCALFKW